MALEIHDHNRDDQSLYDECKGHVYYHVILTMRDGSIVDGDRVTMLVGEDVMELDDENQYAQQRQYNPYGRPRRRHRRYRRRNLSLLDLAKLLIVPYPPYISPYPYYTQYPGQYTNPYYPF